MKLELKHLAPYLDSDLQINLFERNYTVTGLSKETIFTKQGAILNYSSVENEIKPILRPLSDLSRYNDEVIINEHYINSVLTEKEYGNEYGILSCFKGEVDIELEGDPELRYDARKAISFKSIQKIIELLYEGHFDVFGLIEKGLAIDKNKLNK